MKSFFSAIHVMDKYIEVANPTLNYDSYRIIFCVSLSLCAKFYEYEPLRPEMYLNFMKGKISGE